MGIAVGKCKSCGYSIYLFELIFYGYCEECAYFIKEIMREEKRPKFKEYLGRIKSEGKAS